MAPALHYRRRSCESEPAQEGVLVPERFDQARLEATFRACRALRHELATPLSAAGLHLELARRAAERLEGGAPGKLRSGLETGKQQLDESAHLLDGLMALGGARSGSPARVDFAAVVRDAVRDAGPELERRGLSVRARGPSEGLWVDGFADELEPASREVLLAAARWASPGEAHLEMRSAGRDVSFAFRVPLAGGGPGDMLFKTRSRPNAGLGPFLARWTFEAHGGRLDGAEDAGHLTVTATLPQVAP
jgi:signal transduction histidine kinase